MSKFKIPVRAEYAGNNTVGLSEYQNIDSDDNEVISRKFGGTGLDNYDGVIGDILIIGLKPDPDNPGSFIENEDSYKPFTLAEGQILIGAAVGDEIKSGKLFPNEDTAKDHEKYQGFYFDHTTLSADGYPVFTADNSLGPDADVTFRSLHLTAPILQDPIVRDGYGLIVDGNAHIKGHLNFTGEGTTVFDSTSVAISDFNLLLGVDGGLSNYAVPITNGAVSLSEENPEVDGVVTLKHQDVIDAVANDLEDGNWVLVSDVKPANDSVEQTAYQISGKSNTGSNTTFNLVGLPTSITEARVSLAPIQYTTTDGAGIIIPAMNEDDGDTYKPIKFTYDSTNANFVSTDKVQVEDTLLVNSAASTVSVNAAGTILSSSALVIDAQGNNSPDQIVLSTDSSIALNGNTTITGVTDINGNTTIDGTTIVLTGATTIDGNVDHDGDLDLDGNIVNIHAITSVDITSGTGTSSISMGNSGLSLGIGDTKFDMAAAGLAITGDTGITGATTIDGATTITAN